MNQHRAANVRPRRARLVFCAMAALGSLSGCAVVKRAYEPNPQPTAVQPVMPYADPGPVDLSNLDGSLWPGQANWNLFADDKALNLGDTVLVLVRQQNEGTKDASSSTERKSSISASIRLLLGFEDEIQEATTGKAQLFDVESENSFDGSGTTERRDDLTATVSALVIDVLSNGNLVIYGNQIVQVNHEASVLTVQGIVRPSDISPQNTIESNRIANARIEFGGSGIVSDKQHPGWGMRAFDWLWPF